MVSFRDGFEIAERLGHHVPSAFIRTRDWYNAPSGKGGVTALP